MGYAHGFISQNNQGLRESLLKELSGYTRMSHGWDGPGSYAPSMQAYLAARSFIMLLNETTIHGVELSLNTSGTFSFEWMSDGKNITHVEIGKERASAYVKMVWDHSPEKTKYFECQATDQIAFKSILDALTRSIAQRAITAKSI